MYMRLKCSGCGAQTFAERRAIARRLRKRPWTPLSEIDKIANRQPDDGL